MAVHGCSPLPRDVRWDGCVRVGVGACWFVWRDGGSDCAFRQFERGTSDRVRYRRVNERTGEEVDYGDIVKGRPVGGGDYLVVEPEELAEIAPGRSRTLDIHAVCRSARDRSGLFQRTYWLAPAGDGEPKPYALLVRAMTKTERAAVGTFVMRGKEYLAAVRPHGDVLALDTMFFTDEIREPHDHLGDLPDLRKAQGKELEMAVSLVEPMVPRVCCRSVDTRA